MRKSELRKRDIQQIQQLLPVGRPFIVDADNPVIVLDGKGRVICVTSYGRGVMRPSFDEAMANAAFFADAASIIDKLLDEVKRLKKELRKGRKGKTVDTAEDILPFIEPTDMPKPKFFNRPDLARKKAKTKRVA